MFTAREIDYSETGYFSRIVTDYLDHSEKLAPFYLHEVSIEGIKNAITERKKFPVNRKLLVDQLILQYAQVEGNEIIQAQLDSLFNENTFTICTAHQPNIFTGHLYFIHKILHIIRLSEHLKNTMPGYKFVPVFYMGSEDADLDELGHIYIDGEKYTWQTNQTGAVGRMVIDDAFLELINIIYGRFSVERYGPALVEIIRTAYVKGRSVADATFRLLHTLFGDYGLLVLQPDNAVLKTVMTAIFEDDIFNNTAAALVAKTNKSLGELYDVQAHPRQINLFYLDGDKRERLNADKDSFKLNDSSRSFTKEELKTELRSEPGRFSPNVILRGLYQEMIMPGVAFVGGGGELAYWLQLKDLFIHYQVPYPVLLLRNSFLIIEKEQKFILNKLGLTEEQMFLPKTILEKTIVSRLSKLPLELSPEQQQLHHLFEDVKRKATSVDATLAKHSAAIFHKTSAYLDGISKKMVKAEKKKFDAEIRQLTKLRDQLFPHNSLQERVLNFMPYYAKWGPDLISAILGCSLTMEQKFVILTEDILGFNKSEQA